MLNFVSSLFSQTFLSRSKANCQDLLRPFSDPPHLTPTEWVRICHIPVSRYQSRKSAVSQSIWTWCDRREGGVRGGRLAVTAISILLSAELSFFFLTQHWVKLKKKKEKLLINLLFTFTKPLLLPQRILDANRFSGVQRSQQHFDTRELWSTLNGPEFGGPPEDGGLGSPGVVCFRCECKCDVGLQRLTTVAETEQVRCLMLLMQMLCFYKNILQNRGLLSKTEQKKRKKRKQNKQYMEALAFFQMSALLINKQRGRPKLLPAASRSPLRAPPSRWWCEAARSFCVYQQPLWSRMFQEEELHQGRGHGGAASTPPWGQESRAPP